MDRRQFLRLFGTSTVGDRQTKNSSSKPRAPLSSGLEPFVPDADHPWDEYRAAHLLRRVTMAPTPSEIAALVAAGTPGAAVDLVLTAAAAPTPPSVANDVTESLDGLDIISQTQLRGRWQSDAQQLRTWWIGMLQDARVSITEVMTLFWSCHFTTEFVQDDLYVIAPLLYRQNELFRSNALGNFKDLVLGITLDGAMLVYLGGDLSTKSRANENYAREMLELYTTGLGWYTEGDIQEGARILTGWRIAQFNDKPAPNGIFNTYFDPGSHDTGGKVYLGQSFAPRDDSTNTEYLVRKEEIDKMIDVLFDQRASAIATFISRKLYRFFIYSDANSVDETIVAAMAQTFLDNNFEIKPVMSQLLKSAHFFDNDNIGAQLKTPAQYVIGIARQLSSGAKVDTTMTSLDQQLFQPPNVAGWPGYHDWLTSSTYPTRSSFATSIITALTDDDVIAFVKGFANYSDGNSLVDSIATLLLPRPNSTERHQALASRLTAGSPIYDWPSILSTSPSTAARNVRDVLTLVVSLPDFELC